MRFWVFILLSFSAICQETPSFYDRGSYSFGLGLSVPQGLWKGYQAPAGPFFHLDGAVLWNPTAKEKRNAPVMIGVGGGYIGLGRDAVTSAISGNFYRTHNVYWLQALGRYRPIVWPSKWNPFLDVGVGPGLYSSGIYEQLSEEVVRLEGQNALGFTYQAGLGLGKRWDRTHHAPVYLDLTWHVFQSDGLSWVNRNTTQISSDGNITFRRQIRSLSHQKLTLSITGFW